VDECASESGFSEWVPRVDAVYFWTTVRDAQDYLETYFEVPDEYVIVTVDLSNKEMYSADSMVVEDMYHEWMGSGGLEDIEYYIESHMSPWKGVGEGGLEVWCQPPVSSDMIISID
jgi:hypothetical protein